jgi:hypothetical protein
MAQLMQAPAIPAVFFCFSLLSVVVCPSGRRNQVLISLIANADFGDLNGAKHAFFDSSQHKPSIV